jgi:hypothetical protein
LAINLFALLSHFLSSSALFHLCGLATALGRGLRGVEPNKTCHFCKNTHIITFSETKFLPPLFIGNVLQTTCLCLCEMHTSKTQGYKIAQRMHCNYKYKEKLPTLEISDVVATVNIFHNGANTVQMPASRLETWESMEHISNHGLAKRKFQFLYVCI